MAAGSSGIITAVVIDFILLFIFMGLFELFRRKRAFRKFFYPKLYSDKCLMRPPHIKREASFITFARTVLSISDEDMLKITGLDSAIYILMLKFGTIYFTVTSIAVVFVLFPVSGTAGGEKGISYTGIDKLSITYVPAKSPRLWAHAIMFIACLLWLFWLLNKFHIRAVDLRARFFMIRPAGGPSHSVMITDLPGTHVGDYRVKSKQARLNDLKAFIFSEPVADPARLKEIRAADLDELLTAAEGNRAKGGGASEKDKIALLREMADIDSAAVSNSGDDAEAPADAKVTGGEEAPVIDERQVDRVNRRFRERLEDEFSYIYGPGLVKQVALVFDLKEVEQKQKVYDKLRAKLESQIDRYLTRMRLLGLREEEDRIRSQSELADLPAGTSRATSVYTEAPEHAPDMTPKERAALAKRRAKVKFTERDQTGVCLPFAQQWAKDKYKGEGMRPKKEALTYFIEALQNARQELLDAQRRAPRDIAPSCFVTFRDRWACSAATAALHRRTTTAWITQPAPDAEDVVWSNLRLRGWERGIRWFVTTSIIALIVINFTVIITFVQGLCSISQLRAIGLGAIADNPTAKAFLEGFLPGIALKIVLAVLPPILKLLARIQGIHAISLIDFFVVEKFFIFQVIVTFIFNVLGGAILNQRKELIANVGKLPEILAVAVPQTGQFFFTLLLLSALPGTSKGFLRIVGLIIFWIKMKFSPTERAMRKVWDSNQTSFGASFSVTTIIFLLAMVFAVLFPLMLPVALVYFAGTTLLEMYMHGYVLHAKVESRGRLWLTFCNQCMVGVLLAQVVLAALLGLKKTPGPAILVGVFIPVTITYWRWFLRTYSPTLTLLSMHDAVNVDRVQGPYEAKDEFVPRCLTFNEDEHNALLAEAEACGVEVDRAMDIVRQAGGPEKAADFVAAAGGPRALAASRAV